MIVPKKKKTKRQSKGIHTLLIDPERPNIEKPRVETRKMQTATAKQKAIRRTAKESEDAYVAPRNIVTTTLGDLIEGVRTIPEEQQGRMGFADGGLGAKVWVAGDASLVKRPSVAVVGARLVSPQGAARARKLARELAHAGIVVVSGLAQGVDTAALTAAVAAQGKIIAVIGTPITRAYPAENKRLQEKIYSEHLLISQFEPGKPVFPSNFPERNKLMAALSDATAIIEATDESGSLHQAWECVRLKRWLFIARSLVENKSLRWTKDFLNYANTKILTHTSDILDLVRAN